MNGYNFTDRVRKVLQMAREEALRLQHEYVGPEHILLGIMLEGQGVAAAVLMNLNVELKAAQETLGKAVKKGVASRAGNVDLPYTSRSKKVLELAMSEARLLNHSYVGTEHLLLGVLGERKNIAADALSELGITLDTARNEVLRLLGSDMPPHLYALDADQRFKTAIALVELHHLRFGAYPDSLDALQFLGQSERGMLTGMRYEKLEEGYALDVFTYTGTKPELRYSPDFWRGLGIKRTNVEGGPST